MNFKAVVSCAVNGKVYPNYFHREEISKREQLFKATFDLCVPKKDSDLKKTGMALKGLKL